MIEPTQEDIGREVYYKKDHMKPSEYEKGVITGFSETYVFVRYGAETLSKSTYKRDLYWDAALLEAHKSKSTPEKTYCCDAMERAIKTGYWGIVDISGGILLEGQEKDENGEAERIPLTYCLFCGAQLWQECPACHGCGEVMYRAPDPDGGSTPEPRGCFLCTISPGVIPLPRPVLPFNAEELDTLRNVIEAFLTSFAHFEDAGFDEHWHCFLRTNRASWNEKLSSVLQGVITHFNLAKARES